MQFVTRFPNNGHLIWTASSHDLKLLEHYLKEVCHRYHTKQVSAFGTEHESTDETDETNIECSKECTDNDLVNACFWQPRA